MLGTFCAVILHPDLINSVKAFLWRRVQYFVFGSFRIDLEQVHLRQMVALEDVAERYTINSDAAAGTLSLINECSGELARK